MIAEGLFERFPCDQVFALHNAPGLPVGHFAVRHDCMLASSDTVTITVTGRGAHGAMPQQGCDPIVAAASIVTRQAARERGVDPRAPQRDAFEHQQLRPEDQRGG